MCLILITHSLASILVFERFLTSPDRFPSFPMVPGLPEDEHITPFFTIFLKLHYFRTHSHFPIFLSSSTLLYTFVLFLVLLGSTQICGICLWVSGSLRPRPRPRPPSCSNFGAANHKHHQRCSGLPTHILTFEDHRRRQLWSFGGSGASVVAPGRRA